eukprot:m.526791 g.526791  ORF g.526791 m.526791 type:complete len:97 (+) comp57555_c0_seq2:134-424(+)
MEGTCRPLKLRVEQVLSGAVGIVVCYGVSTTLQYYADTISALSSETAPLAILLRQLRALSLQVFFESLQSHAGSLLVKIEIASVHAWLSSARSHLV